MPSIGAVKAPASSPVLPAGGTAGQTLVKSSGVDYAAGWQTITTAGAGRFYQSGLWYDNRPVCVDNTTAAGYAVLGVGCSLYVPLWIASSVTVAALAVTVPSGAATNGTSTGQLGISTMDPVTLQPATLLGSGTVTVNFTQGVLSVPVSITLAVPGWYYIGIGCTGASLGMSYPYAGVLSPGPFARTVASYTPTSQGFWTSTTTGVLSSNPAVTLGNIGVTGNTAFAYGATVWYQAA